MQRKVKGYGWVPDLPDGRDVLYAAPYATVRDLPAKVDLRPGCPPVYDQGQLGSCTANAIGGAHEFNQMKQGEANPFVPSRLFIYYNERVMENTVDADAGAMIRDGVKSVNKQGAPPEDLWPYAIDKFAKKPPAKVYTEAGKHQVVRYQRLTQSLNQLKGCLAEGYPFVFGFTVYDGFEGADVARTGKAQLPKAGEKVLGGHAVMAVGYEERAQRFTVRNSWGDSWGMNGYFTMPYPYLLQGSLSQDFWTIRSVE